MLERTYPEQTLKQVSLSGCITSTISSAIFTASSKYCLFSKLGGWKEETEILRYMYLRSGSLKAPITTPKIRSPHPISSIKISFLDRNQSNSITYITKIFNKLTLFKPFMFICRPYMRPLHKTVRNECVKPSECFFYIAGDVFDILVRLILRTCMKHI